MKQFLAVFKFEYLNFIKNKIFIFLTIAISVIIAVITFYPRFSSSTDISLNLVKQETPTLLIIDKTNVVGLEEILTSNLTSLTNTDVTFTTDGDENSAKISVENEEYDSAIVITSPLEYTYIVKNLGLYDTTEQNINSILLSHYKTIQLQNYGLSMEQIVNISTVTVKGNSLVVGQDQSQNFMHAYILMMVLYITVLVYGQIVAQSVATEKSSRAMELLITSADPKNLIFGKVLGTGFAGLTQMAIILLWGVLCVAINKDYLVDSDIFSMFTGFSASMIIYTIIFFVLGFMLYAFLVGAMGSMASKLEDVGTLTMPVMMFLIIGFLITISLMSSGNIDSGIIKFLSYFPFTAPMAMFARIAMGTATTIQAIISIIILIISIIGVGYLAVAIYRIGILMYGKPPKFNEIIRALKNNK